MNRAAAHTAAIGAFTMNHAEARWEQIRDALQAQIADQSDVVCRIPDWGPVDLAMGLHWLRSAIFEGFYVAYRISRADEKAAVWFKRWEYGEPEPAWPE